MEGIEPPAECPNVSETETSIEEIEVESPKVKPPKVKQTPDAVSDLTNVYRAEAFTVEEANAAASVADSVVVLLAGEANSGKTTLLAELFNLLQRRELSCARFAGSHTLIGFERRCYLARTDSEREVPDTERTKTQTKDHFLALSLQDKSSLSVQVLVADIAGEFFLRAITSDEDAQSIPYAGRADFLVVLADGEKLAKGNKRLSAITNSQRLLNRLIDSSILKDDCKVQFVSTKWDLVEAAPQELEAVAYVTKAEERIAAQVGNKKSIRFLRVAARKRDPEGLDELVAQWLEADVPPDQVIPPFPSIRRMGQVSEVDL